MPTTPSPSFPIAGSPIVGRHYQTGLAVAAHHRDGCIVSIEPASSDPTRLPWMAPPLTDLQVNGFGGIDFQRLGVAQAALEHACQGLLAAGCGRFLLTLITDEWSRQLDRLRLLAALRERSPLLRIMLAGWHVEGPFLSSEPGFHGAHPPEFMIDPKPEHVRDLQSVVGSDPLLLTLAPERDGAAEAIHAAVAAGFRVSLGHTDASEQQLAEAVSAGATGFTHLGNACPQLLDRHNNIFWRVLDLLRPEPSTDHPGTLASGTTPPQARPFCASLIPDSYHIPPALFRTLHAAASPSRLFYVSDAMAGADAPPGSATLGTLQLQVGTDGVVRQPGKTNFAGSALRPIDGVFRAATMLNAAWAECWDRFSLLPATWMGWIPASLRVGAPADLCMFDLPEGDSGCTPGQPVRTGRVRAVVIAGQEVYRSGDHR